MLTRQATDVVEVQPAWAINDDGWCTQAEMITSPNFGPRPSHTDISMLVIHNISLPMGQFGTPYISQLFQNILDHDAHPSFASLKGIRLSSHFLIRRDGQLIQFVSCRERAWHAGLSSFQGRDDCNNYSIGIELEGTDELPFESAQYDSLLKLSEALLATYAITNIVGHQEIAPGRKTDPGPFFDWTRYSNGLAGSWGLDRVT